MRILNYLLSSLLLVSCVQTVDDTVTNFDVHGDSYDQATTILNGQRIEGELYSALDRDYFRLGYDNPIYVSYRLSAFEEPVAFDVWIQREDGVYDVVMTQVVNPGTYERVTLAGSSNYISTGLIARPTSVYDAWEYEIFVEQVVHAP